MNQHYETASKKKIVRLQFEKGESSRVLLLNGDIRKYTRLEKPFCEECKMNEEAKADYDFMRENLKLKK